MQQRKVTLKHLRYLTNDFGVWQHTSVKRINKKYGYALDDAARALLLNSVKDLSLKKVYLQFIKLSFSENSPKTFFGANRLAKDIPFSEDSVGEAYWAVARNDEFELIDPIKQWAVKFQSIRGKSYSLLGAIANRDFNLAEKLSNDIISQYGRNKCSSWLWPENMLSYGNAIIPYSILSYAEESGKYVHLALDMLDFLNKESTHNGVPIAIGNEGWYPKGGKKNLFHQQPIDPAYQVLANIKAFELTKRKSYLEEAKKFYDWFWGFNLLKRSLINYDDSCADAICPWGIQKNRGAESIICFLLAQEAIAKYL